jgi:short-subunit dehydrogenase
MKILQGKWVLITGAASGIGQALAQEFSAAGSNIIIVDINEEGMKNTNSQIEARGGKAICIRADMSKVEEIQSLAVRAVKEAGQIDILVNNAGIAIVSEAQNVTIEEWHKILAINLHGPIFLTHCLLPHMIERRSGHIVNIASIAGLIGIPGFVPYCTTKFGVVGYSEALRVELAGYGIGVTVICPGFVSTPIIHSALIKGFDQKLRAVPSMATITPQKAAKAIVCGVRRNKAKVLPSTMLVQLVYPLKKIMPGLVEFFLRKDYGTWEKALLK